MLYNKPEDWDALDPVAIDWCERHGLGRVLYTCSKKACEAWAYIFKTGAPLHCDAADTNLDIELAYGIATQAFGMYNSLIIAARDAGRADVAKMIYDWGHYSVFY
jgi:hypothetical protein